MSRTYEVERYFFVWPWLLKVKAADMDELLVIFLDACGSGAGATAEEIQQALLKADVVSQEQAAALGCTLRNVARRRGLVRDCHTVKERMRYRTTDQGTQFLREAA